MDLSTSMPSIASTKLRRIRNGRPAISTMASPSRAIVSRSFCSKRRKICCRSAGAPIVATAAISGISAAAKIAAVPPRLCPTSSEGVIPAAVIACAAARRSSMSAAMLTASPGAMLNPVPAKSNLKTPIPARDSARDMCTAARLSFPHVKQCAKIAQPRGVPTGGSRCPVS